MFYISSHKYKGSVEVLGVTDTDDNIEEFYTRDYLLSTGLEIIRLNKELEEGYKFKTKCFEFELVNLDGILGWKLKANKGVETFRNKPYYLGYPVISLKFCFAESDSKSMDLKGMCTSNVITMSRMFYKCKSLTSLDVSNFDTSRVIDMKGMFEYCKSLTRLDVSNFDTSRVTDMRVMFYDCESLTRLDVSNFNTINVTIMSHMFCGCKSLTSLDLINFDTSKVTAMDFMFCRCISLTSLDLSNFDTSKIADMECMFTSCSSLTILDLSNFDTSRVTTMDDIFKDCNKLSLLYTISSKLIDELPSSKTIITVPKSSGIKYDKLVKSKRDIAKYLLMLSNYKVVAYEEE